MRELTFEMNWLQADLKASQKNLKVSVNTVASIQESVPVMCSDEVIEWIVVTFLVIENFRAESISRDSILDSKLTFNNNVKLLCVDQRWWLTNLQYSDRLISYDEVDNVTREARGVGEGSKINHLIWIFFCERVNQLRRKLVITTRFHVCISVPRCCFFLQRWLHCHIFCCWVDDLLWWMHRGCGSHRQILLEVTDICMKIKNIDYVIWSILGYCTNWVKFVVIILGRMLFPC